MHSKYRLAPFQKYSMDIFADFAVCFDSFVTLTPPFTARFNISDGPQTQRNICHGRTRLGQSREAGHAFLLLLLLLHLTQHRPLVASYITVCTHGRARRLHLENLPPKPNLQRKDLLGSFYKSI